jgi:GH18 family chitinase
MNKKFLLLTTAFLFLILAGASSQKINKNTKSPFKVVGYYLLNSILGDSTQADSNYAFLDKVTHINIAFINPDTLGNFKQDLAISAFIDRAHKKRVKVLASIGGGGDHSYYHALLHDDKRALFIRNLISFAKQYNLDGIDVDLEGNDVDPNYEAFVTELAATLRTSGKLMTAAIATWYKDKISDKALQQFDFVSIMSYDATGPWRPERPGPHSPYQIAVDDLQYWSETRLIPKQKLVLGVPFYGYGFGATPEVESMHYNGTQTIRKKTELAMEKAGGIMIWQLLGDAPGENSLLKVIYDRAFKK